MDYTDEELEDLAKMRELRLRLRACADAKVAECEAMHPGKTWLEIYRQMRAIEAADRMVVRLYSPPPKRRATKRPETPAAAAVPRVRSEPAVPRVEKTSAAVAAHEINESVQPADGIAASQAAASALLLPCEAGEEERRSRAPSPAKSVTEGATSDDAIPTPTLSPASEPLLSEAAPEAFDIITEMTRRCAEWVCIWPNGAPFIDGVTDWQPHAMTAGLTLPALDGPALEAWLHGEILRQANIIARQWGRFSGMRLDMTDWCESDPDYWTKSANVGTDTDHPAPGEEPGPPGLPWWIVRAPP